MHKLNINTVCNCEKSTSPPLLLTTNTSVNFNSNFVLLLYSCYSKLFLSLESSILSTHTSRVHWPLLSNDTFFSCRQNSSCMMSCFCFCLLYKHTFFLSLQQPSYSESIIIFRRLLFSYFLGKKSYSNFHVF